MPIETIPKKDRKIENYDLTYLERFILILLTSNNLSKNQIQKAITDASNGNLEFVDSSLYTTISTLESNNYLTKIELTSKKGLKIGGGAKTQILKITDAGEFAVFRENKFKERLANFQLHSTK